MSAAVTVELATAQGLRLVPSLPFAVVEYTLVESDAGALTVEGPLRADVAAALAPDAQLRVWRSVYGGAPYLEGGAVWLLRRWSTTIGANGERRFSLVAQHANTLLGRRIVDAPAGSAAADKTGPADDLIKTIVTEQFVSPTDATRTMPGLSVGPSVAAAPSVSKAFAYQNALSVIKALCAQAAEAGVYLGVEVVPLAGGFQLITFTGQRGVDRSADAGARFSLERRNLASGSLTYDYSDQATRVVAGGRGTGTAREVQRADDAVGQAESPFGLIETFRQATGAATAAAVLGEAAGELWAKRARVRFAGSAQQVQGSLYGIDYGWGDIVPVRFEGVDIACRIPTVRNRVERERGEQLTIQLSGDTVL